MKKDKNMTTIYIVRHGETKWNVKQLMQGHKDSPLTEKGIEQAKDIKKELDNIRFYRVFSSDLMRAKRTAEIISLEKKLAVTTTKALRERSFGKYEGTSVKEMRDLITKLKKSLKKKNFSYGMIDDIENNEKLLLRLIPFLREIAIAYKGKNILVVSHGGVMMFLLIHFGFATYDNFDEKYYIKNTSYIKLESDGVDFFIKETKGIGKEE